MADFNPFSAETSLWPEKSIPGGFMDQISHIISLQYPNNHEGYVMFDHQQRKTYVYSKKICQWLDGLNYSDLKPKLIEELNGKIIKQVDYGEDFIVILTNEGQVYLAGEDAFWKTGNQLKQLLYNKSEETKFKQIACGYGHLLLLTVDNELLAMGWNLSGQITGNSDSYEDMIDTGLKNIAKMSCGTKHCLAINKDNQIFSWGSTKYGRLGLGDCPNEIESEPCQIEFNSKIKDIAAGDSHSLFLTEDGKLYYCGLNYTADRSEEMRDFETKPIILIENITNIATGSFYKFSMAFDMKRNCHVFGLLGNEEFLDITKTKSKVKSFSEASRLYCPENPLTFGWTPLVKPRTQQSDKISFSNLELWRPYLKSIVPSFLETITHFISLQFYRRDGFINYGYVMTTYNKQTFVYGQTICDWISLEHQPERPQLIEGLKSKMVRQVDHGEDYFVILTTDGQVYLGADPNSIWKTDRKLKMISNEEQKFTSIQTISCGSDKILLLTKDNKLIEYSRNIRKGTNNLRGTPNFTESGTIKMDDVIKMDCGLNHCLAIKNNGEIYSWGKNNQGQLGLGHTIERIEPNCIRFINSKAKDVAAGDSYSLFLMEDGTLYECGKKKSTPFKLEIKNVVSIGSRWFFRFSMAFTVDNSCYVWGVINGKDKPTKTIKPAKSFSEASTFYPLVTIPLTFGWTSFVKSKPDFMVISHQFINLWKKHLGNIGDNLLVSIKHFMSMQWFDEDYEEHHNGYVITTNQYQTLVYGSNVCRWLNLNHQLDVPQKIEELNNQSIQQVDHGSNYLVFLCQNGFVYLAGEDSVWKTGNKLKQLCYNDQTKGFKQIACGSKHLLLLTKQNKLMAMGDNSFNQITGNVPDSYEYLVNIELENVMKIFCGDNHCLAITNDFKIFSWGSNYDGQLGLGDKRTDRQQPDFIRNFDCNMRIKDIAANRSNSYFLREDNRLYGCGSNTYGQLGLEQSFEYPVKLGENSMENVIAIASGWSFQFAMAFTIDNCCHVWGLIGEHILKKPTKTVCTVSSFTEATSMYFPKPLTFGWTGVVKLNRGNTNETHSVPEISMWKEWLPEMVHENFLATVTHFISMQWFDDETYREHQNGFVLSTDDGKCKKTWAYGNVCDWLSLENNKRFKPIPELDGKFVKQVDYGQQYVAFLIDDGWLYLAGEDSVWKTQSKIQRLFLEGRKFKQIACGRQHLLLLTNENELIATNPGRFFKNSEKVLVQPIIIDLKNVTKISCGWQHSLAIANEQIYSFGSNYNGLSDSFEASYNDKELYQPKLIEFFEKIPEKCVDIVAGQSHSLFLMDDGKLYCSGNNDYGQLGVIKKNRELKEFETPIPTPVIAIRSGWSSRFSIAFTIDHRCWIWGWIGDCFSKQPKETYRLVSSFSEASGIYLSQPLTFGWIENKKKLERLYLINSKAILESFESQLF